MDSLQIAFSIPWSAIWFCAGFISCIALIVLWHCIPEN